MALAGVTEGFMLGGGVIVKEVSPAPMSAASCTVASADPEYTLRQTFSIQSLNVVPLERDEVVSTGIRESPSKRNRCKCTPFD
jgi:hypothetical protein